MRRFRFMMKWLVRIALAVLLLFMILINLPPVQQFLTGRLEAFLSKKTDSRIEIGAVRLVLPKYLLLEELYFEDQQQDTLLYLERLKTDFRLLPLLKGRLQITFIGLKGLKADLHPTRDSVMNFQFIIDAFSDTSATKSPPPDEPGRNASFNIELPEAEIDLENIDLYYLDPPGTTEMDIELQSLQTRIRAADLRTMTFDIDDFLLSDGHVAMQLLSESPPSEDTTAFAGHFQLKAGQLKLESISYALDLPNLQMYSALDEAMSQQASFYLGPDTMDIRTPHFMLSNGRFVYNDPSAAPADGFDYRHLDLDSIQIAVDSFSYHNLDIQGKVRQIAGRERGSIGLQQLQADWVHYNVDTINITNLQGRTDRSQLVADGTLITFPFIRQGGQLEDMTLAVDLAEASLAPEDILQFAPALGSHPLVRAHRQRALQLYARIDGTLKDLKIHRFDLRGWGSRFDVRGQLGYPTDPEKLRADLKLNDLTVSRSVLAGFLPDGTLPAGTELPASLKTRGTFRGTTADMFIDLEAMLSRPAEPVSAVLQIDGHLNQLLSPGRLWYDLNVDTFFVGSSELRALLPPSILPDSIRLPDKLLVSGNLSGKIDSIDSELKLLVERENQSSWLLIDGYIAGLPEPEDLQFDLVIDSIHLRRPEIAAWLPAARWPSYLQAPEISYARLKASGRPDDLLGAIALTTSFAEIQAQAALRDSSYSIQMAMQHFDLADLFQPPAYDSLIGMDLSPVTLNLKAEGRGFNPRENLQAKIDFSLLPEQLDWQEGLVISGNIDRQAFRGKLSVQEPGAQALLDTDLNFNLDSASYIKAALDLQQLDLRQLKFLETPFTVQTALGLETKGNSMQNFSGSFRLQNLNIQRDSVINHLDSLQLEARLLSNYNEIRLESDIGEGELTGTFTYPAILRDLRILIRSYFDPQIATDSLFTDSRDQFTVNIELSRPDILTTGLIPGLEALEPFTIEGSFLAESRRLDLSTFIPHIRYRAFSFDSIGLALLTAKDSLTYDFSFRKMEAFDQFRAVNLDLTGEVTPDGAIQNTFQQFDSTGQPRFWLQGAIADRKGITTFEMTPRALINYKDWRFSDNNHILISNDTLQVRDWRLARENQEIVLRDQQATDLQVFFQNLDLSLLSDIIKYQSKLVQGTLSGQVEMQDLLGTVSPAAAFEIQDFGLLDAILGDLSLDFQQDPEKNWTATLGLRSNDNDLTFEGTYRPADSLQTIDASLHMNALNLATLEPMFAGTLDQLEGSLSGELRAIGPLSRPEINGQFQFAGTKLRPTLLQTNYRLSEQPLVIRTTDDERGRLTRLDVENFTLSDPSDQQLTLSGGFSIRSLSEFNILANFSARNFTILNTQAKDNELFFGKLKVNADGYIGGRLDSVAVTMNVMPRKNSTFTYILPFDQLQEIESGEGVIEFIDPNATTLQQGPKKQQSPFNFDLFLNTKVNDSLELTIIVNPVAGDQFEGKAEGELALHLSPNGDIDLAGRVEFLEGEYLFTYTDLVRRRFQVKPGSVVSWVGDPYNPELSVTARYITKASPLPLFPNRADMTPQQEKELGRRQEFYANFIITDELEDMEINTEIEYPKTNFNSNNYQVENVIKQLNQDPSQTTSQAFSLLLFNGFTSNNLTGASTIDFKQSFNDLITSYLNNIADEYIKFVELDFGIESSGGDGGSYFEDTDFRVSLKKRFLNNRLEIRVDGVASTREDTQQSSSNQMQAYLDNITVEYALTKDGILKLRVFNQRDVEDFLGGEVIKLGGALVFSKNFKRFSLFGGKKRSTDD